MEEPHLYDSDESEESVERIDIRQGIEVVIARAEDQVREPYVLVEHQSQNVESSGRLDRSKPYVSDKEVDAVIYSAAAALETQNCDRLEKGSQYEHQTLSMDLLQRTLISQKFERFLSSAVPLMEEEVRRNGVLENIS